MTPKEKAQELVDEFKQQLLTITPNINRPIYQAKKFALIAVDEILKLENKHLPFNGYHFDGTNVTRILSFWKEVKQEIENL